MSTVRLVKLGITAAVVMMSVVFIMVAGLALSLLVPGSDPGETPVVEAGGMWYAWLHNPRAGNFIRVYEDGATETHTVELAAGENLGSSPTAFAPNGELLATCTFNESTSERSLVIHSFNPDAAAKAGVVFPVRYPLGQRTECSVMRDAFNLTDPNLIAFGVVNYFPGDPNADTSRPEWELMVFDIAQGTITARYDADMPGADDLRPFEGRGVFMPVVHRFEGATLTFELAPWGTEYIPGQKVIAWQIGSQTVTLVEGPLGQVGLHTNPATGERVWLAVDESRPAAQPMGPMPSYNVVLYQPAPDAEPYPIFHDPDVIPSQLAFVKGGEMLAIQVSPGFDPEASPDVMESPSWHLLDRSGALTPLNLGQFAYTLTGLRDGFAVWEGNFEAWTATLTRYRWETDPANATTSVLWSGDDPNWSLMWAASQPAGDPDAPFPPLP